MFNVAKYRIGFKPTCCICLLITLPVTYMLLNTFVCLVSEFIFRSNTFNMSPSSNPGKDIRKEIHQIFFQSIKFPSVGDICERTSILYKAQSRISIHTME